MAGHSRLKNGVLERLCPGHPRLLVQGRKAWMPGTRPGMANLNARGRNQADRTAEAQKNRRVAPAVSFVKA
jgi:hypothetical protein